MTCVYRNSVTDKNGVGAIDFVAIAVHQGDGEWMVGCPLPEETNRGLKRLSVHVQSRLITVRRQPASLTYIIT